MLIKKLSQADQTVPTIPTRRSRWFSLVLGLALATGSIGLAGCSGSNGSAEGPAGTPAAERIDDPELDRYVETWGEMVELFESFDNAETIRGAGPRFAELAKRMDEIEAELQQKYENFDGDFAVDALHDPRVRQLMERHEREIDRVTSNPDSARALAELMGAPGTESL